MRLWQRILRLLRARSLPLTEAELERALAQLRDDIGKRLAQARYEVAGCAAEERRLASLLQTEERRAALMEARARQALQDGQEQLAWVAMREHLHAVKAAEQMRDLWQRQYTGTQRLQALLAALEDKFADIARRQQLLQAYQQLMRAQHTLVSALSDGDDDGLFEHTEDIMLTHDFMLTREFVEEAYRELADSRLGARAESPELPLSRADTLRPGAVAQ